MLVRYPKYPKRLPKHELRGDSGLHIRWTEGIISSSTPQNTVAPHLEFTQAAARAPVD